MSRYRGLLLSKQVFYKNPLLDRNDLRPYLSDEQFEFRESVHRFLEKNATPEFLRECDENKIFPHELIKAISNQGWFAITLPEEFGGIGGYMDMVAMLEIIGYHSASLARYWNINVNMVGGALVLLANQTTKDNLLPLLAEGKVSFAFALSENGSGSDAAALTTSAIPNDEFFIVNGTKMWISGALTADYILTACRTEKGQGKHEGISLLLIPRDAVGVEVNPINLLGGHMIRTCEINFVDVKVPKINLVGDLHLGWSQLMTVLSKERIALAAICTGAAQAAVIQAGQYAADRNQFGRSLTAFQAISHKLSDMQTLVDASRMLTYRAARLLDEGIDCVRESSQAKYFAGDAYMQIATNGIQIMGANGYSMEFPMQRHFREAKLFQIFGGTNEIQRNIVAKNLLE